MKPPVLGKPVPGIPLYEPDHAQREMARLAEDAQMLNLDEAFQAQVNPTDHEDQLRRQNIQYIESLPTPCCQVGGIFFELSKHVVCQLCSKRYTFDANLNMVRVMSVFALGEER